MTDNILSFPFLVVPPAYADAIGYYTVSVVDETDAFVYFKYRIYHIEYTIFALTTL